MGLKTDFVKVAQSGKTIDGREIKPEWLLDAAVTYSKDTYTACVFPDHNEMAQSYGTVEELRTEKKGDVVSLFARISPNAFWQSDMRYGQNLFTSIAIMPNFAGTGKFYLYSLAATNNPASLGVEKLEFSKKEPTALFSTAFDTKQASSTQEFTEQEKSLFGKFLQFFKQDNEDMANKALEELQAKSSAMEKDFNDLKAKKSGDSGTGDDNAAKFSAIEKENGELKAKVASLETENSEFKTKFETLSTQFGEYKTKVDEALKEAPGSDGNDKKFGADVPDKKVINGINSDWL